MLRVVGSIAHDHDLWLIVLAGLVCLLAANTSVRLLDHRVDDDERRRAIRTGGAIIAFSAGIWTTATVFLVLISLYVSGILGARSQEAGLAQLLSG